MLDFEEYSKICPEIKMERRNGILLMTFHTNGDTIQWDDDPKNYPRMYYQIAEAFQNVGNDTQNKVIIWTGAGKDFSGPTKLGVTLPRRTPRKWERSNWKGRYLVMNLLNIDVPIICAINGPAPVHAEMALLCDIVLASDTATIQDTSHMPRGGVPGDGVQVVYPLLLGLNRGRYFLLTGQCLDAKQALDLGLVAEVMPREKLLPRAWELAEQLASKPPLTLRFAKTLLIREVRRRMMDDQGFGLALEGLSNLDNEQGPLPRV